MGTIAWIRSSANSRPSSKPCKSTARRGHLHGRGAPVAVFIGERGLDWHEVTPLDRQAGIADVLRKGASAKPAQPVCVGLPGAVRVPENTYGTASTAGPWPA